MGRKLAVFAVPVALILLLVSVDIPRALATVVVPAVLVDFPFHSSLHWCHATRCTAFGLLSP
jgi:hypothetical protein